MLKKLNTKSRGFITASILAMMLGPLRITAQVSVEVSFDQQQYLPYEPVIMEVKITNFSGQTLRFGEDPSWMEIWIETSQGIPVRELKPPQLIVPFEVPNASRAIRRLNLTPHYDIYNPGQYKVTVTIYSKELAQRIQSEPAKFVVVRATPMWEQTFGYVRSPELPGYETRRYALVQKPIGRRTILYVQVTNADGSVVYGLIPVGQLLTFSRPEAQLDRESNLHVLWQIEGQRFWHVVIDPEGNLKLRATYRYGLTRPRLHPGEEGSVTVIGGYREPLPIDIPPPQLGSETNAPNTATNVVSPQIGSPKKP